MPSAHDFNPATGLSREQYRDNWMSSGISNMDQMRDWLAVNGGTVLADNGSVMTPYGDALDMGEAFRTGNGRPGWGQIDAPGQANGSQMGSSMQQNPYAPSNPGMVNPGAMPYNPHAQGNTGMNTGFAGGMTRTPVSTNGSLVGTQMSFGPSPMQQSNAIGTVGQSAGSMTRMARPHVMPRTQAFDSLQQPLGAPSTFGQRKTPTDTSSITSMETA